MNKCSCFNTQICLEIQKGSFEVIPFINLTRGRFVDTSLFLLSWGIVSTLLQGLLTLSALPTSLDNALLSPPMWLLGSCQLLMTSSQRSDIFQIWKLQTNLHHYSQRTYLFMILSFSYKK